MEQNGYYARLHSYQDHVPNMRTVSSPQLGRTTLGQGAEA